MTENSSRFAFVFVRVLLMSFGVGGIVHAQSNEVFLTTTSRLVRFDMGTQSFAVNSNHGDVFQGVTVLNGQVLVADYANDTIRRFSPNGVYQGTFASGFSPAYLESDGGGNVYSTPTHTLFEPQIGRRFDASGVVTQTFSNPGIQRPEGIDADAAGNVYIVDDHPSLTANRLFKFAPDGTFLNSISLGTTTAADLAIDEAGNRLFVAVEFSAGLGVKIFDISATVPAPLGSIVTPANANIFGVYFAPESGNVLATDDGAGSDDPRGLEYSPAGVLLREYRAANHELAFDIATFAPVPEPDSATLALAGMIAFLLCISRSRTAVALVR